MARLDAEAKRVLAQSELVADLLVGAAIAYAGQRADAFDDRIVELADSVNRWLGGSERDVEPS